MAIRKTERKQERKVLMVHMPRLVKYSLSRLLSAVVMMLSLNVLDLAPPVSRLGVR
jgi:hypothetical protein